MRRILVAVAVLCLTPRLAPALEINNLRSAYGPQGVARTNNKFLPGDALFMEFDIEGLKADEKTGKVSYEIKLEFLDSKNTQIFERKTPNEAIAQLGGNRMPGDLFVLLGFNTNPGKYTVKLTVTDKYATKSTSLVYPMEVLPPAFGIIRVQAMGLGLPANHYVATFALVGMKLDDKTKVPNVDVAIRVLDENKKPVAPDVHYLLPRDMPEGVDVQKLQFVPMTFPVYLNRPGRFTIDITAVDRNSKNVQAELRLPLLVLDIPSLLGGAK